MHTLEATTCVQNCVMCNAESKLNLQSFEGIIWSKWEDLNCWRKFVLGIAEVNERNDMKYNLNTTYHSDLRCCVRV